MPVDFSRVQIGEVYTRQQLASLWGYAGHEAISRGIITPKNTRAIILFITYEQRETLIQYENRLASGLLEIDGETSHAADDRIVNAMAAGDETHLFYRERHEMPFAYYGPIRLIHHEIRTNAPSRFIFRVPSEYPDESLQTELITHGQVNEEFVPDPEGRQILRLHISYERSARNRRRALECHGNRCLACNTSFDELYGPEHARGYIEVHHTRSITQINGPVNPDTDLIPLCSNCHAMAHKVRGKILSLTELQALLRKRTADA